MKKADTKDYDRDMEQVYSKAVDRMEPASQEQKSTEHAIAGEMAPVA